VERDVLELTKFGNGFGERRGFRTARCGAKREDDGELIQDDGGILYKHGIREIQLGGERNDADAEFFQKLLVGAMLRARDLEIDGLARNEAKFAIYDGWADGARDGGEHVGRPSLHENFAED
jgi:hypothetical protein